MDVKVKRVLEHWILGLIDYPRFARNLIDGLKVNTESKVKSTITLNDKFYELNISLKEKKPLGAEPPIMIKLDGEDIYRKIQELNKKEPKKEGF